MLVVLLDIICCLLWLVVDWLAALTSFLDLSSSQLKLLRRRARKRLRTMKLPMTRAGRKMARQDSGFPCTVQAYHSLLPALFDC